MSVVVVKSILVGVMALFSIIFGLLPIKLVKVLADPNAKFFNRRSSLIISLFSCFAGGVFLSVCFLDMLPDALESWQNAQNELRWHSNYPFVTLITLISFFIVFIFEEISTLCCNIPHSHSHGDDIFSTKTDETSEYHEEYKTRDRFATVGSLFNADGTIVRPRSVSIQSADNNGGEARVQRSIVFVSAFLLHVILESFAFGVQKDLKSTASLFVGIIIHKIIVMFSIGVKLTRNHPRRWWLVVVFIVIIALCNLIGGFTGILIESSDMNQTAKDLTSSVLMSVSLGTFLYISFFEMLAPERANPHSNILQWIASVIGFVIFAAIIVI